MPKKLLLVFTRNPELGKVKTRLAKKVGAETALKIYTFLLPLVPRSMSRDIPPVWRPR